MYGDYEVQWWSIQNDDTGDGSVKCSPEERAEVLQYSLAALHFPSPYENASFDLTSVSSPAKIQHFVDKRRSSHYAEFEFYHQCYDAVLALALALNKTIEGTNNTEVLIDKCVQMFQLSLSADIELKTNETLRDIAAQQAGLPGESSFHITDFNYGVGVVANLLKKFLEDTNFIGVSVSMQDHFQLIL